MGQTPPSTPVMTDHHNNKNKSIPSYSYEQEKDHDNNRNSQQQQQQQQHKSLSLLKWPKRKSDKTKSLSYMKYSTTSTSTSSSLSKNKKEKKDKKDKKDKKSKPMPSHHGDVEATRNRFMSIGDSHEHITESHVVDVLLNVINIVLKPADETISEDSLIFCGSSIPKISLKDYLARLVHYLSGLAEFERITGNDISIRSDIAFRYLILVLIFLDRLNKRPDFEITERNIHRLLITGVLIASKVADDIQPKNAYFAQLGGLTVNEINKLESEFCRLLEFNFFVGQEEFESYQRKILHANATASNAASTSFVESIPTSQSDLNEDSGPPPLSRKKSLEMSKMLKRQASNAAAA